MLSHKQSFITTLTQIIKCSFAKKKSTSLDNSARYTNKITEQTGKVTKTWKACLLRKNVLQTKLADYFTKQQNGSRWTLRQLESKLMKNQRLFKHIWRFHLCNSIHLAYDTVNHHRLLIIYTNDSCNKDINIATE